MRKTYSLIMREHGGHEIEAAAYGDGESQTIECLDCSVVLVDKSDNPGLFRRFIFRLQKETVQQGEAV